MRGGEYLVIEVLGEGNMATVYLVCPPNLPLLRYAVKMVKLPEQAESALRTEFLRCFERERQIMEQVSHLHHPNIAALYGAGTSQDGAPYIILEQLEGETLHAHLNRSGPLLLSEALRITMQIGEALTAIHSLDVVHRDLSTRNVFVCRPRTEGAKETALIKLIDFGVAKFAGTTLHPGVYGSPAYMAPEQAAGGEFIDARADQFALAAILFEMISGESAFAEPADPAQQVMQRVQQEDLGARLFALPVAPPVRAALERALSKDPKQRYRSVQEFLSALQEPERMPPRGAGPADSVRTAAAAGATLTPLALPGLGSYAGMAVFVLLCAVAAYKVASSRHPGAAGNPRPPAKLDLGAVTSTPTAGRDIAPEPVQDQVPTKPQPAVAELDAGHPGPAGDTPPGPKEPAGSPPASANPPAPPQTQPPRRGGRGGEHRPSGAARSQIHVEPRFGQNDVSPAIKVAAASAAIQCLEQQRARHRLPAACRLKLTRSRTQSAYFVTDPDCTLSNNDFAVSLELCIADGMRKKGVVPLPESLHIVISSQTSEGRALQ